MGAVDNMFLNMWKGCSIKLRGGLQAEEMVARQQQHRWAQQ